LKTRIEKVNGQNKNLVDTFDRQFTVKEKIALSMKDGTLTYSVVPIQPYEKEVTVDEVEDIDSFIDNDEKVIFLAFVNDQPVIYIKFVDLYSVASMHIHSKISSRMKLPYFGIWCSKC
jgi:hypothetical protein